MEKGIIILDNNSGITDKKVIASKLLEWFISSDYSQTFFYRGEVSSLRYEISKGERYEENITNALNKIYGRYFTKPKIDVTVIEKDNSLISVLIEIQVKENDIEFNLNEVVEYKELEQITNDSSLDDYRQHLIK